MGCMALCRIFHTASEQEQGPIPIVPHCSGSSPAPCPGTGHSQCDYTIHPSTLLFALFLTFVTGRNEVVAKVIFLHLFAILFTGGVSASVHAGIPHPQEQTPPGADPLEQTPPQEQTPPPPGADTP